MRPILAAAGVKPADLEVVALMREPMAWFSSWYRYRSRPELKNPNNPSHNNYTGKVSFEEFLDAYLSESRPPFARLRDPVDFLLNSKGLIGPTRVFRYESPAWQDYLHQRFEGQEFNFRPVNVSPSKDVPNLGKHWKEKFAHLYRVYDNLAEDGNTDKVNAVLQSARASTAGNPESLARS